MAGVKAMLNERLEAGMSDEAAMDWNIPIPPTGPNIAHELRADEQAGPLTPTAMPRE